MTIPRYHACTSVRPDGFGSNGIYDLELDRVAAFVNPYTRDACLLELQEGKSHIKDFRWKSSEEFGLDPQWRDALAQGPNTVGPGKYSFLAENS